ncbi:hypothetical protein CYY_003470 [Polysphondylium violaceum]|uniref:Ribosomal protein L9 domain-containing protein n=1 Tax=Polysphondylium violaceum TaxID=133409 RepID=A0A8J4V8M3_9MYCE|nr:hypothetical protein CYY_003470 [Polysphondylium violaceum]
MITSICKNSLKSNNNPYLSLSSLFKQSCSINQSVNYSSKTIPIILVQDIDKVGQKGEEIEVKKGYARNFFFMKGLAVHATHENRKKYEEFSQKIDYTTRRLEKENLKAIKKITKDNRLIIMRTSLPDGSPSVNIDVDNIVYSLKRRKNVVIDPKTINLPAPIDNFGTHPISIQFGAREVPLIIQFETL